MFVVFLRSSYNCSKEDYFDETVFCMKVLKINCLFFCTYSFAKVLAESLWNRITPGTCQWHQTAVDLFLRLHNIAPLRETCENLILNSLVSLDLVSFK